MTTRKSTRVEGGAPPTDISDSLLIQSCGWTSQCAFTISLSATSVSLSRESAQEVGKIHSRISRFCDARNASERLERGQLQLRPRGGLAAYVIVISIR